MNARGAGPEQLIELIRASVIGDDEAFAGPFGVRRLTYADYTASGRSLAFIEDYIRDQVMPLYANTHTESSGTGLQTTRFREDARDIIREAVGADRDEYAVIFCGSGSTAAVDKLIGILNLRIPADLDAALRPQRAHPAPTSGRSSSSAPTSITPTSCPGASRSPTWSPSARTPTAASTSASWPMSSARYAGRPLKIGSFSAASNVTGIKSDTRAISTLLHRHGALAFWDYGAAAPYVGPAHDAATSRLMTATAAEAPLDYKDAVFISPHKFIGGPGTPGLLVVRKALLTNSVPGRSRRRHRRLRQRRGARLPRRSRASRGGRHARHHRVHPCRARLPAQGRQSAPRPSATARSRSSSGRWSAGAQVPGLEVLGDLELGRASRSSASWSATRSRYLHHNYVVALLNDLFGIQSRGGCSCAGPYGHRLLGIDIETSHEFEREITRGCEGIKPGWVRVNFNYFISETVFEYILDAVELVAREGWRLLPHYRFDPATGLWHHVGRQAEAPLSLRDIRYAAEGMRYKAHRRQEPERRLADYLAEARALMADAARAGRAAAGAADLVVGDDFEGLRWFLLPDEAASELGTQA